jgi:hypothetical protein
MNTALRAFLLFVILLVLALLLGQAGTVPIPVSLQIGSLTAQTTAPVAITLGLTILLVAFYLGRLTGWLTRLPGKWLNRKSSQVADRIADAYAAYYLANPTLAHQHLAGLKPDTPAHADLIHLLELQLPPLPPLLSDRHLANPRTAALTALAYAHAAAAQADWAEVKRLTTLGRPFAPENPRLLVLQFKALVNTNDPAATEALPSLKPLLGRPRHQLLSQIISNPTALAARPLPDQKWLKSLEIWLATPSDVFPE